MLKENDMVKLHPKYDKTIKERSVYKVIGPRQTTWTHHCIYEDCSGYELLTVSDGSITWAYECDVEKIHNMIRLK